MMNIHAMIYPVINALNSGLPWAEGSFLLDGTKIATSIL
jgi:hypothetical protein